MKRKLTVVLFTFCVVLFTTTLAYAGVKDTFLGVVGRVGWEAVAYGLTAILAVGGMATKAKWLSYVFLVIQTAFACFATFFETAGSVFGWAGSALQDGKLSSDEIKQAPAMIKQAKKSIQETWTTVGDAWRSFKNT